MEELFRQRKNSAEKNKKNLIHTMFTFITDVILSGLWLDACKQFGCSLTFMCTKTNSEKSKRESSDLYDVIVEAGRFNSSYKGLLLKKKKLISSDIKKKVETTQTRW